MEVFIKNQKGFSILQTIISTALLSLVFLAGFRTIKNQLKVSENSSSDFELIYLFDEMKGFLANSSNCKASFGGKSANYDEIDFLKSAQKGQGMVYERFALKNKTYGQSNIKIKSMRLESATDEYNLDADLTMFHVEFEKINEFSLSEIISRKMAVHVRVTDIGVVEDCFTLGSYLWQSGGNRKRSEWYMQGSSTVRFDGPNVNIGFDAQTSHGLGVRGKLNAPLEDRLSCRPSLEGMIGFNARRKKVVGCDGIEWRELKKRQIYNLDKDMIDFNAKGKKDNRTLTDKKYYYCEIVQNDIGNGLCRVTPVERTSKKYWNLLAEHKEGRDTRCRARCFY